MYPLLFLVTSFAILFTSFILWLRSSDVKVQTGKTPFHRFRGVYKLCLGPRTHTWTIHQKIKRIIKSHNKNNNNKNNNNKIDDYNNEDINKDINDDNDTREKSCEGLRGCDGKKEGLKFFSIYYDASAVLDSDRVRWVAGCVAEEETEEDGAAVRNTLIKPDIVETLKKNGFREQLFPGASSCLKVDLAIKNQYSMFSIFLKLLPTLTKYIKAEGLKTQTIVEYHTNPNNCVLFSPIENEKDFEVEGVDELGKRIEDLIKKYK